MKKQEAIQIFTQDPPRPEKIDLRVSAETKAKFTEMRNAKAKITGPLAREIQKLIDQYYDAFKRLGA